TPLYDRLEREGRLVPDDDTVWFEPKLMSRETLKRGYADLNQRLWVPEAFFDRIFTGNEASPPFRKRRHEMDFRRKRAPFERLLGAYCYLIMVWRLSRALARERLLGTVGWAYVKAYKAYSIPLGREAPPLSQFIAMCLRHYHHFKVAAHGRTCWGRA